MFNFQGTSAALAAAYLEYHSRIGKSRKIFRFSDFCSVDRNSRAGFPRRLANIAPGKAKVKHYFCKNAIFFCASASCVQTTKRPPYRVVFSIARGLAPVFSFLHLRGREGRASHAGFPAALSEAGASLSLFGFLPLRRRGGRISHAGFPAALILGGLSLFRGCRGLLRGCA